MLAHKLKKSTVVPVLWLSTGRYLKMLADDSQDIIVNKNEYVTQVPPGHNRNSLTD